MIAVIKISRGKFKDLGNVFQKIQRFFSRAGFKDFIIFRLATLSKLTVAVIL